MKMKMVVMKVVVFVLVLSGVLCDSEGLHEELRLVGCSESDAEVVTRLDGEAAWYADFHQQTGVEPQPGFIDHVYFQQAEYRQAEQHLQLCRRGLDTLRGFYEGEGDGQQEQDPPSRPMVYPRDRVEPGETNVLVCHVTGFYPAPVTFSWTRNQQNLTGGTSTNVPSLNKDGTFQQFSRLDFTPQPGDIYGCTVTHLGLQKTRFWDVQQPQTSFIPAVFCRLGLAVGLLGVAVGTFFFVKGNEFK